MKAKSKPKIFDNQIERLLTAEEVAKLIGFSVVSVRRWTHLERIPFIKLGYGVRYRASDINRWIDQHARGL